MNASAAFFDLEAAKAGAPIRTRCGVAARFIAHVPECHEGCRVLVLLDGDDHVTSYAEDGVAGPDFMRADDLFTTWEVVSEQRASEASGE